MVATGQSAANALGIVKPVVAKLGNPSPVQTIRVRPWKVLPNRSIAASHSSTKAWSEAWYWGWPGKANASNRSHISLGGMPPNWAWFGVLMLLGRIISLEAAVGPATSTDTSRGLSPYRAARAPRKVLNAPLYAEFHGIGRTPPPASTNPWNVALPQSSGGVWGGDLNRPSQLGISSSSHFGAAKPADTWSWMVFAAVEGFAAFHAATELKASSR